MYRTTKAPRKQKPESPKEPAHPDCAIYTRSTQEDDQTDKILYLDFDGLKLGKLRELKRRMLDLRTGKCDWSDIHQPLAENLRKVVGSGQCTSIMSSPETFSILFVVRSDKTEEVANEIKKHFEKFKFTVGIFP